MRTIRAHYDGTTFVPDEPTDAKAGEPVTVHLDDHAPDAQAADVVSALADSEKTTFNQLMDLIGGPIDDPDWPADGAKEYKHYLYGTPKHYD